MGIMLFLYQLVVVIGGSSFSETDTLAVCRADVVMALITRLLVCSEVTLDSLSFSA